MVLLRHGWMSTNCELRDACVGEEIMVQRVSLRTLGRCRTCKATNRQQDRRTGYWRFQRWPPTMCVFQADGDSVLSVLCTP